MEGLEREGLEIEIKKEGDEARKGQRTNHSVISIN
jgi:hypothetical protein